VGANRAWTIVKRIAPFIVLPLFLALVVLLLVPGLFKPAKELSVSVLLRRNEGSGVEDPTIQKMRDKVVTRRLSEMAVREEPQPPLARVGLFPAVELEKEEKMQILRNSRLYHELRENIQRKERKRVFFDVPRPKTADVKGGRLPLPEDQVAQQFVDSLRKSTGTSGQEHHNPPEDTILDIRGPAAGRKISYIPPPLPSQPAVDGDILLKFWILPDGTIGKVIPLVKEGGVSRAAIVHIRQYRFEPLPQDSHQVAIWGIIPLKSVLR
jgi:hypothetical protein